MGINVVWKSESGNELECIYDPKMLLSHLIINNYKDFKNTYCVHFIDPYGDTIFNQHQIPILITELEGIANTTSDEVTKEHILSILNLSRKSLGQIHTYLWFIGD
jgi:hypothetical protein